MRVEVDWLFCQHLDTQGEHLPEWVRLQPYHLELGKWASSLEEALCRESQISSPLTLQCTLLFPQQGALPLLYLCHVQICQFTYHTTALLHHKLLPTLAFPGFAAALTEG